jgi:hypothetical protein
MYLWRAQFGYQFIKTNTKRTILFLTRSKFGGNEKKISLDTIDTTLCPLLLHVDHLN